MSHNHTLYKKQISAIHSVAEGVYVLSFLRSFTFTAGQVIAIDVVPDGEARLYSIASGEQDKDIEILFDERPEGRLTPILSRLCAGDSIYVSEPFGSFRSDAGKAYWIAAGTGIAPFVSMLRSGKADYKTLVHGGRYDENFYFASLIENNFSGKYIRCCSQQEDTAYYKGRLTGWLKEHDLATDNRYYLCGSAEMVVQVRDILISKDIPFQNIVSETYF